MMLPLSPPSQPICPSSHPLSSLISIDHLAGAPISRHEQPAPLPAPHAPDPISQSKLAALNCPAPVGHHNGRIMRAPLSWAGDGRDGFSFLPIRLALFCSIPSLPPATCARPSRFKLHRQSQLGWSGKLSQPMKAGSSARDGWSCLSTGQLDSSEDNASMQEFNSITPSPAHDWHPLPPLLRAGVPRAETSGCTVSAGRLLMSKTSRKSPSPFTSQLPSTKHCIFRTRNIGHARAIFMAGPSPSRLRSLFPGSSASNSPDDQPPGTQ